MSYELKQEDFNSLLGFINGLSESEKKSALIRVLYEAQAIFGFLPKEVILFIGEKMDIPSSTIYGVVSFYSYFTTTPKGKHQIKICKGTACFVCGAEDVSKEFEHQLGIKTGGVTEDMQFSLESVRCVGACGLAPAVLVDELVYAKVMPSEVKKIIKKHKG